MNNQIYRQRTSIVKNKDKAKHTRNIMNVVYDTVNDGYYNKYNTT